MITQDLKLSSSVSAENIKHDDSLQKLKKTSAEKEKATENYRKASFTKRHLFTLAATFMLLLGGAFSVYLLQPEFQEMNLGRMNTVGGMILLILTSFLLIFRLSFLAYIAKLFFSYKPVTSVTDEELPTCTVIVPAYNEGKQVYSTLKSLVNSDYPAGKLQLIAIDDGSKDDTWEWMKIAKEELGERVSIYQQPHNQGKRHALYRGFNMGTGEVFVTVDSDSIVQKDTLRNLVSPFVTNQNCGAVAGNVRVLNNEKAIIPRMLNVSFVFSFEFIRSAQSVLGSVLCTPGALAAYRGKAVMNCLPEWINQTFMGQPTDIGEDRAMTNMILKQGYHVLFQRNAYVLTNIPEKFSSLHKMFTRWERSNVRENLMMSKFAFKTFRNGSKSGPRILLINQWMQMLTTYPLFIIMIVLLLLHPVLFISSTLLSILIFSTLPAFFYARKYNISEAFWAYSYSLFYTFGLFWIAPYAMATANRRGWLTRELPKKR
ncbi:glycosyltransferase [Zunongwangia sp. F363]|uniref:Glycosyltransferase n=1 Tax=Autumnicola tepida TaxID=3075595 RepID=A0ABU3CEL2_9FLAO|nr:glycosyltransferase [Zunongwangia sp. F363]MDT0644667.1 glycosyltransferase [Zunongwangia sp. F363]